MIHPARFLAPAFAAALLAVSVDASAGQLQLRDEAHLFGSADTAQLKALVAQAPFDTRVVTTTNYTDQAAFSRYVGTLVSEPDMVVVGLDPDHHHVQVHFGTGSRIPHAAWSSIEHAGNDAFRQGAWEQGSEAIVRSAMSSATSGGTVSSPGAGAPAAQQGTSFMGPLLLLLLIAGVIGAVVWFARRRSMGPGVAPYGGDPYAGTGTPYGGAPGPYGGPGPYYGPGVAPQGGMGPVGGGLIGAGLGGLAGYELGKMEGEREEQRRDEPLVGGREDVGNTGGSFDAGGGGSDWDDGGGGDGGGGFDGGGDGGGGGSDF